MITLVTTTRSRPEGFALTERWMARQTLKWDQWVVVCDGGFKDYQFTLGQEAIERKPRKKELHSFCENWLAAIPLIRGDKVMVIEDDDWYGADYLEALSGMLEEAPLAGFCQAWYYHLPTRSYTLYHNWDWASLAATGFRRGLLADVAEICRTNYVYVDMALWQRGHAHVMRDNFRGKKPLYHVGIKGVPGIVGIGAGHSHQRSKDPTMRALRKRIGKEDWEVYMECCKRWFS